MTESKTTNPKNVLSVDDDLEFSHWHLPDLTPDKSHGPSNMFGKKPRAHVVEEYEETNPAPLTMSQLEEMRAIAEQDGFEQGKQEGYLAGIEQGRLEGLEQGHQEGLAQGEQQGLEAGKATAEDLVTRFSLIVEQFEKPLSVLDMEIESELLGLVMSLAKSVVIHELKTHPEHILAVLRQGVDALPIKEQRVKIRVNSLDAELIGQFYSQEQLAKLSWQLDIDPSLAQGDCIIDSARSSVDLRLEERIAQVLSQLHDQHQALENEIHNNKGEEQHYTSQTMSEDQQPTANPLDEAFIPQSSSDQISSSSSDVEQASSVAESEPQSLTNPDENYSHTAEPKVENIGQSATKAQSDNASIEKMAPQDNATHTDTSKSVDSQATQASSGAKKTLSSTVNTSASSEKIVPKGDS